MAHRANILHCKSLFISISMPNPCESLFYNCLKSMHMLESFLTSNMAFFVRVQNQEGFVRVFFMATACVDVARKKTLTHTLKWSLCGKDSDKWEPKYSIRIDSDKNDQPMC